MSFALDFKAKKRKRNTRTCSKGYNCGNSCIQRALKCRRKFSDQASTYAGWLKKQGEKTTPNPKQEKKKEIAESKPKEVAKVARRIMDSIPEPKPTPKEAVENIKPLTDAERSQPEKLIEVGKAFVERFIKPGQIEEEIAAYNQKREEYIARETARINLPGSTEYSIKPFDKVAELSKKQENTFMDFEISEVDRGRKLAKLGRELENAKDRLPHNRTLAKLKEGIENNSPLTFDEANEAVFEKSDLADYTDDIGEALTIGDDFASVIQLTGDAPKRLLIRKSRDRAYAEKLGNRGSMINIGDSYTREQSVKSAKSTMFHEYSHTSEFRHQEIAIANQKWIKSRSTSDTPKKINDIMSSSSYGNEEVAYPDDFISPYVGKDYTPQTGEPEEYKATEVLSIGMEYLTAPNKMAELFTKDPEHFYLTIGSIIEIQNKNRG